jgi:hypothetical protein
VVVSPSALSPIILPLPVLPQILNSVT